MVAIGGNNINNEIKQKENIIIITISWLKFRQLITEIDNEKLKEKILQILEIHGIRKKLWLQSLPKDIETINIDSVDNISKKMELSEALIEVRKANRVIYAFQKRMMNLVLYIKESCEGKNCKPSYLLSSSMPNNLTNTNWTWDFIPTFACYYQIELKDDYKLYVISLLDTGFTEIKEEKKEFDIEKFKEPNDSKSLLIFYLSNNKQKQDIKPIVKNFLKNNQTDDNGLLVKFDLSEFED